MKTHFIVYIATAQMPGSCPYPYDLSRVAARICPVSGTVSHA